MVTQLSSLDLNKVYSYADYLTWQFEERVELIKGRLFKMSPSPSVRHQEVSANMFFELRKQLDSNPCKIFSAPFDVRLPRANEDSETSLSVVQPDICVICDLSKLDEKGCVGAPDLVVEILSPSTSRKDTRDKFELYQEAGVKEYWIVHPYEKTLIINRLNTDGLYETAGRLLGEGDQAESKVFKGLEVDLEKVFAG